MKVLLLFVLLSALAAAVGAVQAVSAAEGSPLDRVPLPEKMVPDGFREVLVRVGDTLYISGQPTEQGLERLHELGVTTVINLRTHSEMDNRSVVPFDEAAAVRALGMRYVHIPAGGPESPYSPTMVDAFASAMEEALEGASGNVALHCTVAWRASHLYTAYLYRHRGLTLAEALNHGRAINLGALPLEGFLGARLNFQTEASLQTAPEQNAQ